MTAIVAHGFDAADDDRTGNGPDQALKIRPHHSFILRVHGVGIHLIDQTLVAIRSYDNSDSMRQLFCRLVFEINEARGNENEKQDHGDHYVVMEAAAFVRPEQVALDGAPGAIHANSV